MLLLRPLGPRHLSDCAGACFTIPQPWRSVSDPAGGLVGRSLEQTRGSMYTESMTAISDKLLEEVTNTIVETAKPWKVVLFGSRVRGNAGPESDIDILVIEDEPFGPGRSRRKEMARLWHALSRFDVAKDILVYARNEAERWEKSRNHVVAHALKSGRTLYERS